MKAQIIKPSPGLSGVIDNYMLVDIDWQRLAAEDLCNTLNSRSNLLFLTNVNQTLPKPMLMQKIEDLIGSAAAGGYRQYHGGFFKVLLSAEQTGGAMALMDSTLPKGAEPPPHLHTREDEMFYLLEGNVQFRIGDTVIDWVPGTAIFAPRQVPHQIIITTPTARFLTLITPGDFLAYFVETSVETDAPKIVPPQGPPPAEVIAQMTIRLREKYGVLLT